jgi:hypothetical protein
MNFEQNKSNKAIQGELMRIKSLSSTELKQVKKVRLKGDYEMWKVTVKNQLLIRGVWSGVVRNLSADQSNWPIEKEEKAQGIIGPTYLLLVSELTSAMEIWEKIAEECKEDAAQAVLDAKAFIYRGKFQSQ